MQYPCGCNFKTIDFENIFNSDAYQLGGCPAVWDLLASGRTKGIFQLETLLGQHWVKMLKPTNMSHLAAIIAILRPGVLNAKDENGVSMAEHYVKRKNGEEAVAYLHESLEPILSETFGIIIYQESVIKIAQQICGMSESEADLLRKGIGKKDTKVVAECKSVFIDGAEKAAIIPSDVAGTLWTNVEKSNRYLFNQCLSPDTVVVDQDGIDWTLDNITVGAMIETPSGLSLVLAKYDNGEKEVFEVTVESGRTITCALDHKFLCDDGEIRPLFAILDEGRAVWCRPATAEKIIGVRPLGRQRTVDIEVANDSHIFYGNGIATSNSHSYEYGTNLYWSAFAKAHDPLKFFNSYLYFAHEKMKPRDEIHQLVNDAKFFDVRVRVPDLRDKFEHFTIKDEEIYFGLSDVKGLGEAQFKSIDACQLDVRSFVHFLFSAKDAIHQHTIKSLISVGALDFLNLPRTRMLYELDALNKLTGGELKWGIENVGIDKSVTEFIEAVAPQKRRAKDEIDSRKFGGANSPARENLLLGLVASLKNPPYKLTDDISFLASLETEYLGVSITNHKVDDCVTAGANCTCKEFVDGRRGAITIAAEITRAKTIRTKKGDDMAFLTVGDGTCEMDNVVVFADVYEECGHLLSEQNTVLLVGERDKKKGGLIVRRVVQI